MSQVISAYDVFTPRAPAQLNFVSRESLDDQLTDALRTPGTQLIVYGESGSGKSTLLLNKLWQTYSGHITTQCTATTTYEQMLLDAFDQLDQYYVEGRSRQKNRSISPSVAADFFRIKASLNATVSSSSDESHVRLIPPQLTTQRLAQFLGAQNMCWVIEDFHKTRAGEKPPFAQALKVFSDVSAAYPEVKTITIGATETATQVVNYDNEVANRIAEIHVPLMTDDELASILLNGQRLLNIDLTQLVEPIVQYSAGVPSVCHQLALNSCLAGGIITNQKHVIVLGSDDLDLGIERYIKESSALLKAAFEKALAQRRAQYNYPRIILNAIAAGPLEGITFPDLFAYIRTIVHEYPSENLKRYLKRLTEDSRGSILRAGANGRYRFANPLYHTYAQITLIRETDMDATMSGGSVGAIATNILIPQFSEDRIYAEDRRNRGAVLILGVGALGAMLAEELARLGISPLHLLDPDLLEAPNIVRHVLGAGEIGQAKALALAKRIHSDLPLCDVRGIDRDFLRMPADEQLQLVQNCDVVVAATDSTECQRRINEVCLSAEVPAVYTSIWLDSRLHDAEVGEILWVSAGRRTPCYLCTFGWRHAEAAAKANPDARPDIRVVALAAVWVVAGLINPKDERAAILDPDRSLILVHGFMPTSQAVRDLFDRNNIRSVHVPFPEVPCPACGGQRTPNRAPGG